MPVNEPMSVPLLVPVCGGGSVVCDGGGISANSVPLLVLLLMRYEYQYSAAMLVLL